MKPRRWILALMLVPALLILGFLAAWRLLGLEERLRGELVRLLEARGLERVELAAVHPAWVGLDLQDLGLSRAGGGLRLESRMVRLRLAPLVWLKSPTRALAAVQRVDLENFILVLDDSLLHKRSQTRPTFQQWLQGLKPTLGNMPEVRLSQGAIQWRRPGGEFLSLVDGLDGQVFRHSGMVDVLLRSQVLDNEHQAFHADMRLDAQTLDGRFSLQLDSLSQSILEPERLPELKEADVGVNLHVGGRLAAGALDSLSGAGTVVVNQLVLVREGGVVRGRLDLGLDADSLWVQRGALDWDGQGLECQASMPWRLEGARLWARGHDWDLRPVAQALGRMQGQTPPELSGLAAFTLQGHWRNGPRLDGQLELSQVILKERNLGDASLAASWQAGSATVKELRWSPMAGVSIEGGAELSLGKGVEQVGAVLHLQAETEGLAALRGKVARGSLALVDVDLLLRRAGPQWRIERGEVEGSLEGRDGPLLSATGEVLAGQMVGESLPACRLFLITPEGRSLGSAEWLDSATGSWQASLALIPRTLGALFDLEPGLLPPDLGGEIYLQGMARRTEALAQLDWRGRRATLDGLLAWSDTLRSITAALTVEGWRGRQVQGQVEAVLDGSRLELTRLQLENVESRGWVDLESRLCLVDLSVEDQALEPFWDLLFEQEAPRGLGRLSLLAGGEGPLDRLGLRGGLEWRDRLLERQALVRADLSVDANHAGLERGNIGLDGENWATFSLDWAMKEGPRRMLLDLLGRDVSALLPAEPGGRTWIKGPLDGHLEMDLRAGGSRRLTGHVHMEMPRLGPLQFERLDAGISEGPAAGLLALDSLVLERGGPSPLALRAKGLLATGQDKSDVEIGLRGDLLEPLTLTMDGRQSSFFKAASGMGEISLRLVGNMLEPQIREGRIELKDAQLDMASVFRKVRDLQLLGQIENGRLQLERGWARVGGTRLRISNTWEAVADGQALEPWVFERPELDCGVIELATVDELGRDAPVEVTIPGLMEPDWSGRLTLKGAAPGERFWFAGPLERPMVRGLAVVDNAQFTYPFIKGVEAPTPLLRAVIDFLNRIDWDMAVQGGRNVNYWKKVQGFDDNRFVDRLKGYLDRITVDLFVDPMPQPLWMRGQIEDESFRIQGEATCRKGSVIFLDKEFDVEDAGLVFDPTSLMPTVWGRAVHSMLSAEQDPGLQSMFSQDARQIWLQLCTTDELGNRQLRGRWDEIRVELMDELNGSQDLLEKGQEELLVDMGLNPYDAGGAIESMLPDVVAGFWEIPLRPIESRIRRQLGLDQVRIFLPVLRNTVEELLSTQTTQEQISQSYLDYLQGTRVILGKSLGPRTFASWTGQLVATHPVEGQAVVGLFQRCNLDYQVSRNLNLTGELVFDPLRDVGLIKGDPRILLRYRQSY